MNKNNILISTIWNYDFNLNHVKLSYIGFLNSIQCLYDKYNFRKY